MVCWILGVAVIINLFGAREFVSRHPAFIWTLIAVAIVGLWLPALLAVRAGRYPRAHFAARTVANALLLLFLASLLVFKWSSEVVMSLVLATIAAYATRVVVAWRTARSLRR